MIEFTVETEIRRPPEDVFAYATDPALLSTWQTNTVSAVREDEGPMGVGSRLREVHAAPGGKKLESLVEVSVYEPPRAFSLAVIEGTPIHAELTFEPTGAGTRLRFRGYGGLGGIARLAEPLLQRSLKRQFTQACENLKRELEASPS